MEANKTLTYEELKELVRTYWNRKILGEGSGGGEDEATKASMAKGDDSSSGIICYGCGSAGHKHFNCPKKRRCGSCGPGKHGVKSSSIRVCMEVKNRFQSKERVKLGNIGRKMNNKGRPKAIIDEN